SARADAMGSSLGAASALVFSSCFSSATRVSSLRLKAHQAVAPMAAESSVNTMVGMPGRRPTIVFTLLSAAIGATAWFAFKRKEETRVAEEKQEEKTKAEAAPKEEPIASALALDLLRVELGYGLLPLINDVQGHRITDQIKALRRQLATEMGFVMPSVRIL